MGESEKPSKRKVTLRKGATETGIAAELVSLLETVTSDGMITESEADALRGWLEANRNSDLPAIDFLRTTLDQILADGRVTPEELRALHLAVERVLPQELREKAKGRRLASELLEKAREREAKAALRDERSKNKSIYTANFMVAGVTYEDRAEIVDLYLKAGQTVFLVRDPGNAHDPNAIEIRLEGGHQIGFVPREDAGEMAPLLDAGCKQKAYCTKILDGRVAPIPVVQVNLYRADSTVGGAITSSDVPSRIKEQFLRKMFSGPRSARNAQRKSAAVRRKKPSSVNSTREQASANSVAPRSGCGCGGCLTAGLWIALLLASLLASSVMLFSWMAA